MKTIINLALLGGLLYLSRTLTLETRDVWFLVAALHVNMAVKEFES